ncbi:hypothetical protein AB3X96_34940 [Paraburkholderia sp. BR13439]|uniref:hypothetical protein n=1 Tax=unclassified Paraburkholderia TaxID=2615204 RepID=UPI0034CF255F
MTRTNLDDSTAAQELAIEGALAPAESHASSNPIEGHTATSHHPDAPGGTVDARFDWLDNASPFAQVEF